MDELEWASASELSPLLLSGDLTVEALAHRCLERIELRDSSVRAWSFIDPDLVLAQARHLDRMPQRGPLHGLPIGVKDVILTRDMPTRYNSSIHRDDPPYQDAACVSLLRNAGALIFGKLDTVEFASTGLRAQTRNPHNLEHTPGASSSGSAAAVADGHVPMALGTQTGGSMIRPASFCGVYAIKPTWNLVSNEGAKTFATSLDTLGWFARTAEDLALMYEVLDPEMSREPSFEISRAKIGVCRTPMWDKADAATRSAMGNAADALADAGAQVTELQLPPPFETLAEQQLVVMHSEGRSAFLPEYRSHRDQLGPGIRNQVENQRNDSRDALIDAYNSAAQGRILFDEIARRYDVILTPSTTGAAPKGLEFTGDLVFNGIWSLLHVPCVNVPGFRAETGLPVGLTLTSGRFRDRTVLAAAKAVGAVFKAWPV